MIISAKSTHGEGCTMPSSPLPASAACSAENAECSSSLLTCRCQSGYYQSGTNTCSAGMWNGTICLSLQCCLFLLLFMCLFVVYFKHQSLQCITLLYITVHPILGQPCTSPSSTLPAIVACSTEHAECSSSSLTCQCRTGYYQSGTNICSAGM